MTKTERQQKWRQGKRAAAAAEIAQAAQAASPHAEARPKPVVDYVIRNLAILGQSMGCVPADCIL